jgi:molybdopterin/thiamine biosynthesis adenylyltransferase/rhodanese-related sulfurtransferase
MNDSELVRYNRHIRMPEIGFGGQEKFRTARVLVVGAGGLGCPVIQYLAAAGVGCIGVVDFDVVEESNLQRQILFGTSDIGKHKVLCAQEKITQLNPHVQVEVHAFALTESNALELLALYDIILDGSDNFQTRYLVSDAAVILKKPLVFGSVYKFEGQVSVFNYKDGPTYRCLYPESGNLGSCAEVGVLGVLPGTIGCMMATEALKIISGAGEVLSGKLLVYDALQGRSIVFSFPAVEANKSIQAIQPFNAQCPDEFPETTAKNLLLLQESEMKLFILDVREAWEYDLHNIGGVLIPLDRLKENLARIPRDIPVIVHCESGVRSHRAMTLLKNEGFRNISNLKGGIQSMRR